MDAPFCYGRKKNLLATSVVHWKRFHTSLKWLILLIWPWKKENKMKIIWSIRVASSGLICFSILLVFFFFSLIDEFPLWNPSRPCLLIFFPGLIIKSIFLHENPKLNLSQFRGKKPDGICDNTFFKPLMCYSQRFVNNAQRNKNRILHFKPWSLSCPLWAVNHVEMYFGKKPRLFFIDEPINASHRANDEMKFHSCWNTFLFWL